MTQGYEQTFKDICQIMIDRGIPLSVANLRNELCSPTQSLMLSGRETRWRNEVAVANKMVWDGTHWIKL